MQPASVYVRAIGVAALVLIGFGTYLAYTLYVDFGPRNAHYRAVNTTPLDQERIGQLSLNQSIDELKPPPAADNNNTLFAYYTLKDGAKIATNFNDDKIIRIIVNESRSYATARGIQIGDSKDKIVQTYGDNFYSRAEQGSDIIGYMDKKLNRTIEFWLTDDIVYSMRLDMASMD